MGRSNLENRGGGRSQKKKRGKALPPISSITHQKAFSQEKIQVHSYRAFFGRVQ